MITENDINQATNSVDLDKLMNQAASERNCELDSCVSYPVSADFLEEEAPKAGNGEESMLEMAQLLRCANKRWYEL